MRRPAVIAPFQPRLDWSIWFAAMSTPSEYPWTLHFTWKLLHGDRGALSLLANDPFPGAPPRWVVLPVRVRAARRSQPRLVETPAGWRLAAAAIRGRSGTRCRRARLAAGAVRSGRWQDLLVAILRGAWWHRRYEELAFPRRRGGIMLVFVRPAGIAQDSREVTMSRMAPMRIALGVALATVGFPIRPAF